MLGGGQSGYVNLKDTLKGGPAGPSRAFSDGTQSVSAWMDSPFVVGGGEATSAAQTQTGVPGNAPVGGGHYPSTVDSRNPNLSSFDVEKLALILVAGIVAARVLK